MFDFEKLEVYQKLFALNVQVLKWMAGNKNLDPYLKDQWRRSTLSAAFNLAEGAGRITKPDKKRFYTMARSSVFETVAIMQIIHEIGVLESDLYHEFYDQYTSVSKMLLAMYRSLKD